MNRRAVVTRCLAPALLLLGLAGCAQEPQQVIVLQQPRVVTCDTRFALTNLSGAPIREFYFSHSSRPGWGVDQLGQNVLPAGRTINYTAAEVGLYDFRVVWMNGLNAELRGIDICRASRITATRGGLSAS
ncbi:hypothetical protein [Muricoccus radiodurans]|uniref:hypothetical protein n=1 Tax=Muricoccus radiodurans TaxID=2231721 RepID=UPI003CFAB376